MCDVQRFGGDMKQRKSGRGGVLLAVALLALVGCLSPVSARAGGGDAVELRVVQRDTLISICRAYLRTPARWPEIGRINRLGDNNLIMPGQRLVIPVELLRGVPRDGRVTFTRAEVMVRSAGQKKWRPLRSGDPVRQGSLIRTGSQAAVEIVFPDGSSLFQQPDTTLDLSASQLKAGSHLFRRLLISAGRVLVRVRHATGQGSRMEIRTPSALAVARGTDFRVAADAVRGTTAEVLEGVVQVDARRRTVMVRQGEGTLVRQGQPPLPPRALLPPPCLGESRQLFRGTPIQISLQPVDGATAHRLLLSRDREGRELVREQLFRTGETPRFSGLEDGVYYCQALSVDDRGLEGPFSTPVELTLRANPLPPFIQEPRDTALLSGKRISFRWLKVADAASYQLQISPEPGFPPDSTTLVELNVTTHEQDFGDVGRRFFRIRSVASDGFRGTWSDPVSFTLIPPPPAPLLEKPSREGNRIHLRWPSQGAGFGYHFQLADNERFESPLVDRHLSEPQVSLEAPRRAGVYYARTSSIDPQGNEGPFSPSQSFEVKRWWPLAAGGALGAAGLILLLVL